MEVKRLVLKRVMDHKRANKLKTKFLTDKSYSILITEDTDAYDVNGNLLFKYRKNVIPLDVLKSGYDAFKGSIEMTEGRGAAAGGVSNRVLKDGTVSKRLVAAKVESGNVGYMDPTQGKAVNFCRKTAFAKRYFDKFQQGVPFVEFIDSKYAELCPDHYGRQIAIANGTDINYRIGRTAFTTVTVNRNFQTAVHQDSGDFQDGFGNLIVYREGHYDGAYFCLVEWGVAIDMQNGDLLFADVHKWHGNTPFANCSDDYLRIAFVMYYREYMYQCKKPSDELQMVKMRETGFLTL